VNIQLVKHLILDNQRITCHEIAQETNLSVGTVNTIIHEHLHFQKLGACWVSRQLSTFVQNRSVEICSTLKEHFDREGQDFLDHVITCEESKAHNFTLESKQASKRQKHVHSPPPKKFVSAGDG
ncbi:unnamed protein product, partial [Staurois parvus]